MRLTIRYKIGDRGCAPAVDEQELEAMKISSLTATERYDVMPDSVVTSSASILKR